MCGAPPQREAFANGESYRLANSNADKKNPEGMRFYNKWVQDKIMPLWQELSRAFPDECAAMVNIYLDPPPRALLPPRPHVEAG